MPPSYVRVHIRHSTAHVWTAWDRGTERRTLRTSNSPSVSPTPGSFGSLMAKVHLANLDVGVGAGDRPNADAAVDGVLSTSSPFSSLSMK